MLFSREDTFQLEELSRECLASLCRQGRSSGFFQYYTTQTHTRVQNEKGQ